MVDVDTIAQALAPALAEQSLELYDVELSGTGRARILRVMVDREGGVDLEAIADATQAVSPLLDAAPLDSVLAGPYALEVSSPGVERPLRTAAHFADAVGETVVVKTRATEDRAVRRVRGVLDRAAESGFDLTLDDGGTEHLDYGDVAQARTVFEWGPQPKRGTTKKPRKSANANSRSANFSREPVRP